MKETLERMDSGALFMVLGHEREGRDLIAKNDPLFEKALQDELNNITLPGEGEKAESVRSLFNQYRSTLKVILEPEANPGIKHHAYFTKLLPLFQKIKETADDILRMNQENMLAADLQAREKALSARQQMYLMLLMAALVSGVFLFFTGRWILRPVHRLIRFADEIKNGNLDLVVPIDSNDEIGRLSQSFNAMAEHLRQTRRSDQARLVRIQDSTQHTFNSLPDAVAVIDPEGKVEVATESARTLFGLKPGVPCSEPPVRVAGRSIQRGPPKRPPGGVRWKTEAPFSILIVGRNDTFVPMAVPVLDSEKQLNGVVIDAEGRYGAAASG